MILRNPDSEHGTSELSQDASDPVAAVGCCFGVVIVRASEVRDFYRGYAVVGVPALVIAVLTGIVHFAI